METLRMSNSSTIRLELLREIYHSFGDLFQISFDTHSHFRESVMLSCSSSHQATVAVWWS